MHDGVAAHAPASVPAELAAESHHGGAHESDGGRPTQDHGAESHGPCSCVRHCSVVGTPAIAASPVIALVREAITIAAPIPANAHVAHRDARQGHPYLPNAPPASV